MFANLVRINILKFRKNGFALWGAIVAFMTTIAFCVVYYITLKDEPDYFTKLTGEDENPELIPHLFFTDMARGFLGLFYSICVIVLICDHYSLRERVNLRGAIRSNFKYTLSELAATFVYAPVFAVVPVILVDFPVGALGYDCILFTGDVTKILLYFAATTLVMWLSIIPAFLIAKIVRRTNYSILILFVWKFLALILADMGSVPVSKILHISGNAADRLPDELSNPGMWAINYIIGDDTGMGIFQICSYAVIFVLLWGTLIYIASRRKEEL